MQLFLILRDLLVFGLLFAVPGLLIARWLLPEDGSDAGPEPLERAIVSLAAGFGGVGVLAFTFSLLTLTHLSWIHVTLAALAVSGLARHRLRRQGRWTSLPEIARSATDRTRLGVLLLAAMFSIFLVNYDRAHFQYGCIHTVVQLALDDSVEIGSPFSDAGSPQERAAENRRRVDPNPIRGDRERPPAWMNPLVFIGDTGQRYGTTAMIAPAAAVFGFFGFRLTYALHAMLLAGFLFLLGRRLIGSDRLAALAVALAMVNPWLLKISLLDENLMSATWAAGALLMATRTVPAPALAGLFCGLALGIRHIDLGLAAGVAILLAAAAMQSGQSARQAWRSAGTPMLLGLMWALLHEAVHHQVAYGSLLSYEHFADEVWFHTTYEAFGRTFSYAGLLNWPFAESVIRTPYNGLPTFLLIPLSVLAHLGSLAVALSLVGLVSLARRWRVLAVALLLWVLPIAAMHLVLEDWLDPNKMGIPVTLQPVLALGLVMGIRAALDRRTALVTVALAVLLSLCARGARSVDVPDDPAFYAKYPLVRQEQPVYAEEDRARWTRGNPLPDWRWLSQHSPFAPIARLRALWGELGDRDLRQGPLAPIRVGPADGEQRLRLDLATPLVGRRDFLAPTGASTSVELDLREPGTAIVVEDLRLPWADRPGALLAVHEEGQRIRLFLRFGVEDFGDFESVQGFTIDARHRGSVQRTGATGHQIALLIPRPATLEIAETVSLDQVLIYRWDGVATADGVLLSDWRKLFHN